MSTQVAIAHDYLTQRGGAERVVVELAKLFPDAPIFTSVYAPDECFDYFRKRTVVELAPRSWRPILRRDHRLGLFRLARWFSAANLDVKVLICSSSGFSHFTTNQGNKVVYCHNPPRWLYGQTEYGIGGRWLTSALLLHGGRLREQDRTAAHTADVYIANSTVVKQRVSEAYGLDAIVLHPPVSNIPVGPSATATPASGYYLIVSRLLPYKNVHLVVDAFRSRPELSSRNLVIVGDGPLAGEIAAKAKGNVCFLGRVDDEELGALYSNCAGLIAPAYEDFGLTPIEAAHFGRPTLALDFGGYRDSIVPGRTGCFMPNLSPESIVEGIQSLESSEFSSEEIRRRAEEFSPRHFASRLEAVLGQVVGR